MLFIFYQQAKRTAWNRETGIPAYEGFMAPLRECADLINSVIGALK